MTVTRAECVALDAADPLGRFRDLFHLPAGMIYMDGNSMGAQPLQTRARMRAIVEEEWPEHLVTGWLADNWMDSPRRCGDLVAQLVGAAVGEVVIADSTSVCLFKLLSAALQLRPDRNVILTDTANFPTDLYVAQGLVAASAGGVSLRIVPTEQIPEALTDDVAVLMLTHVDYRTAFMHDMDAVTKAAHAAGALMLWDLSHSTGAVEVDLGRAGADLAVGCGYKYLNGGPGAPAFLYIAAQHQEHMQNVIAGWLGHASPFTFEQTYAPAPGIARMVSGSPPVMAIVALQSAVEVTLDAGMSALRRKSVELTDLFIALVDELCEGTGAEIASPRNSALRGSHVAVRHEYGYGVVRAMAERGVIGDFRDPDIARFAMTPLYTSYADVFDAVAHLAAVLHAGEHLDPAHRVRNAIT